MLKQAKGVKEDDGGFLEASRRRLLIESRASGVCDDDFNTSTQIIDGQFRATRLWARLIQRFYMGMPRTRHRRQFTVYEQSFTGKEAVDFLLHELPAHIVDGRPISRANCSALLQKFGESGLFKNPRARDDEQFVFIDNGTIYTFVEGAERTACTPMLVRRAASVGRGDGNSGGRTGGTMGSGSRRGPMLVTPRTITPITPVGQYRKVNSPSWGQTIPVEPSRPLGSTRRLSTSHGNLPSMLNKKDEQLEYLFDSECSLAETIDSVKAEVDFKMSRAMNKGLEESGKPISSASNATSGGSKNSTLRKADSKENVQPREHTTPRGGSFRQRLLGFRSAERKAVRPTLFRSEDTENQEEKSVEKNEQLQHLLRFRSVTEEDIKEIWRNTFVERLRQLTGLIELRFLTWTVDGSNVQWNCERINESGLVKALPNNSADALTKEQLKMMHYLERFPFLTTSSSVITYAPGQEVNMFKTLCAHLAKERPALPAAFAHAILALSRHFKNKSQKVQQYLTSLQVETEFGAAHEPTRRLVERRRSPASTVSSSSLSSAHFGPPEDSLRCMDAVSPVPSQGIQQDASRRQQRTAPILDAQKKTIRGGGDELMYVDNVLHLPGLIHSPDLMHKIRDLQLNSTSSSAVELCSAKATATVGGELPVAPSPIPSNAEDSSPDVSVNTSTIPAQYAHTPTFQPLFNSGNSVYYSARPAFAVGAPESSLSTDADFVSSVCVLLLSLPPTRRRRLQQLVSCMSKIADNFNLVLEPGTENRDLILGKLSSSLVSECEEGGSPLTARETLAIATFLLDHEKLVNAVPKYLVEQANAKKIALSKEQVMIPLEGIPPSPVQFCQQVSVDTYNAQTREQDKMIEDLLVQLLHDPKLSDVEKKKKLRMYKQTYPAIYERYFPNDRALPSTLQPQAQRGGSFLKKVFGPRNE